MLTVATLLWDPRPDGLATSRCYDETWVDKLYRGFARNLSRPFELAVFSDRLRSYAEPVRQHLLARPEAGYGCCIEPFKLDTPTLIVGLDTVVVGNCDDLAAGCETGRLIGLPKSPGKPYACNGVALVPAGWRCVFDHWRGENDMEWLRRWPHAFLDDELPGRVKSWKLQARPDGLGDARIIYFHGEAKPHQLGDLPWIREHWR